MLTKVRVVIGFPSEFKRLDRIGCVWLGAVAFLGVVAPISRFPPILCGRWFRGKNHASVSTWGKIKNSSALHSDAAWQKYFDWTSWRWYDSRYNSSSFCLLLSRLWLWLELNSYALVYLPLARLVMLLSVFSSSLKFHRMGTRKLFAQVGAFPLLFYVWCCFSRCWYLEVTGRKRFLSSSYSLSLSIEGRFFTQLFLHWWWLELMKHLLLQLVEHRFC